MSSSFRNDLDRISRESHEHTARSRKSCDHSREHIRQSKAAVERSLELLRQPYVTVGD